MWDSVQEVFGIDFGEALLKCVVTSHSETHCILYGMVWRTSLFGCGFQKGGEGVKVGTWLQSMSQFVKRDVVISLFAFWFPPKLLTFLPTPKGDT